MSCARPIFSDSLLLPIKISVFGVVSVAPNPFQKGVNLDFARPYCSAFAPALRKCFNIAFAIFSPDSSASATSHAGDDKEGQEVPEDAAQGCRDAALSRLRRRAHRGVPRLREHDAKLVDAQDEICMNMLQRLETMNTKAQIMFQKATESKYHLCGNSDSDNTDGETSTATSTSDFAVSSDDLEDC